MPVFALSIFLGGCGYSVHRHSSLPFTEISLGPIENKTHEPKLQDKLHRALIREFLKQGIGINPSAGHKLSGVINNFSMIGLSDKDGITVEYRVVVDADFKFIDGEGNTRDMKNIGAPFIVSLTGSEDLGKLLAAREVAQKRALNDIAMEIAGMLIYK